MSIVTPTDCPKSVRNCCVIEVFGGVFVLLCYFLDFSVGVGTFVIGLSQISSFFTFVECIHKTYRFMLTLWSRKYHLIFKVKIWKITAISEKYWFQQVEHMQVQNGTGPGVQRSKCPLLNLY